MAQDIESRLFALLACVALFYFFGTRIRFLLQGRWYRGLAQEEREKLAKHDPDWYDDHVRPMPRALLVSGVIVAGVIFGCLAYRALVR